MKRLRNFGWLGAEDVTRLILSFAILTLIARHLGPVDLGVLSYLFGVAGLLAPLATFGLDVVIIRRLVAEPQNTARILGTALAIRIARRHDSRCDRDCVRR